MEDQAGVFKERRDRANMDGSLLAEANNRLAVQMVYWLGVLGALPDARTPSSYVNHHPLLAAGRYWQGPHRAFQGEVCKDDEWADASFSNIQGNTRHKHFDVDTPGFHLEADGMVNTIGNERAPSPQSQQQFVTHLLIGESFQNPVAPACPDRGLSQRKKQGQLWGNTYYIPARQILIHSQLKTEWIVGNGGHCPAAVPFKDNACKD
ncbi:unnamed protein product [Lota lota]